MKNIKLITLLLLIWSAGLGESATADESFWVRESAFLLQRGRIEKGIFQPLIYGFSENLEFSTHALAFFVMPNLSIKLSHQNVGNWRFASTHGLIYPTPLLRLISREGTGGIISPEFSIPHLIGISNGVLVSRQFQSELITLKAAIDVGLKMGKLDERTTIDLPLVYPRLNSFYTSCGMKFGLDVRHQFSSKFDILADADWFVFPGSDDGFAWEHKILVAYHSRRNRFSLGYKLVYGEYPFGKAWHLIAPIFDYQRAWGK
ncbi:MAG: hypothetical protein COT43_08670 [Candidatus Marinimicrobia bacterium CG08_land_8_20_14_0_20_45_22]|nr:MAG: hypothetical protein COT43_08670 [Candidatus Marinimicrobia bacterium CG08_land_8_20_14_0_20_45_22]